MSEGANDVPLCAICLQALHSDRPETLKCGHAYHTACIGKWFDFKQAWQCPTCRKDIAARIVPWNDTYSVLLRIESKPWAAVMDSLPTTAEFREQLLRALPLLPSIAKFWKRHQHATYSACARKFGAFYFSARDERTFRILFRAHSVQHRVCVSQAHFFCLAQALCVVQDYDEFAAANPGAVPLTPAPRRLPLIAPSEPTP